MNTKNNKRKKESREKIEQALFELLQVKALNKITVSEICKKAKLNRSTFYANYIDIYDLTDKIKEKIEAIIFELYQDEITKGISSHNYLPLFQHIQQNQILYQTYFKMGYDERKETYRYDMVLAEKYFKSQFIEYHMAFFKSGLTKVIKLWLENDCKETPEQIFEIIKSEYKGRE